MLAGLQVKEIDAIRLEKVTKREGEEGWEEAGR